jgi:septal ring factor EnvC (AmiA/AmiB activator)
MNRLLALILVLAAPGWADPSPKPSLRKVRHEIQKKKAHLSETQKRIRKEASQLKTEERKEGSTLQELQSLNSELAVAENELATHRHNLAVVDARLEDLAQRLERERLEAEARRQELAKRIVSLYKAGPLRGLEFLLSSRDPAEFLNRGRFLKVLARQDKTLLEQAQEDIGKAESSSRQVEAKKAEIQSLRSEAEQGQRRVSLQQEKKLHFLAQVKREKARTERVLEGLRRQAASLQGLLEHLHGEQKALALAAARRPRLRVRRHSLALGKPPRGAWPVKGRLLSRFGKQRHPDLGVWVFNKGIEIAAPSGTPFHAAAPGSVLFSGPFEGLGNMVVVDHGAYCYSVYARAGALEVAKGDEVDAGAELGVVGTAAAFPDPSLFFEVTIKGKPVDPLAWLKRKNRRGIS